MSFTGISTLSDLNIQQLNGSATVYGLDKINAEIVKSLDNYNTQVSELLSMYAEPVEIQTKVFDLASDLTMTETDEFGKSRTKANTGKWTVSFPIRKFVSGVGYSLEWLQRATVGEVNRKFMDLQLAHQKNYVKQVKTAIFTSASSTFVDEHFNGETLVLKPFWNADANHNDSIPANANGDTFAVASHTHYIGSTSGSVAAADIDALVELVTEHDMTENVIIAINAADLDTIKALTTGFTALSSTLMNYSGVNSTVQKLDLSNLANRPVGLWKESYMIWVKPYVPANYAVCMCLDNSMGKPLGYRQLPFANMKGLKLNNKYAGEPMIADEAICFEGLSIMNRSAGACLQLNNSSYTSPTIS